MSAKAQRALLLACVCALIAGFYAATFDIRDLTDTDLNSMQTRALVLHGDVDVSRYEVSPIAYAFPHEGGLYSVYGVGISVVSAPIYAIVARLDVSDSAAQGAAVIPFVALAVVAMWRVLLRHFAAPLATAGVVAFGFGTTMWPLAAMGFYQHASVALFHTLGIGGFLAKDRRGAFLAGLGFGAAAFVRTPATVPLAVAGLYLLIRDRRAAFAFGLGALAPVAGIVIQNRWIWGTWLTGGYSVAGIGFRGDVGEGLWGLLLSWWRGLLVYSPFLGLGFVGWVLAFRRRRSFLEGRLAVLGVSCLATIVLYSRWSTWHGGLNQFGYRYLLDVVPFLVVLGLFAVRSLPRIRPLALALGILSIMTMAFGVEPNRFAWDGTWFASTFEQASIGQAWIVFSHRPLGGLLRLAGVAVIAWLLLTLSRQIPARRAELAA
jgi:hypothetical protein